MRFGKEMAALPQPDRKTLKPNSSRNTFFNSRNRLSFQVVYCQQRLFRHSCHRPSQRLPSLSFIPFAMLSSIIHGFPTAA